MSGRGLLARLRTPDGVRSARASAEDSILENLRSILNTCQGSAPSSPGFGLPSFVDLVHGFPESVQSMQRAIKVAIEVFEPRLRQVLVRHVPDDNPLMLRFEISAQVAGAPGRVRFASQFTSGGRASVLSA